MSDEIRTDDEDVEAHGPAGLEGPGFAAADAEPTSDDEPDVEAHGPAGLEGPALTGPALTGPANV